MERAVQIVRQARFLKHISIEHNEVAEKMVLALLENGRLSQQALIAVTSSLSPDVAKEEVKSTFIEMVQEQYIEQCPTASLPPPQFRKLDAKGQRKSLSDANSFKIEQEELRQDYLKSRFQIPDATDDIFEDVKQVGQKRGRDSKVATERLVLWRVNFEEFNKRFRHQRCGEFLRDKEGQQKGLVVEALLRAQRKQETEVCAPISQLVSPVEMTREVDRLCELYEDYEHPTDEIDDLLQELSGSEYGYVKEGPEGPQGDCYTVDMDIVIQLRKIKDLEGIIKQRFDSSGLRIFKLLYLRGYMEERVVADLAMVEIKHCRSLLMQMFQAGYVSLQEIPKTSDHKPQSTIYTFFVNLEQAFRQVAKDLYKTLDNLNYKVKSINEKESELLKSLQIHGDVNKLSDSQKQRLLATTRKLSMLEGAMVKLDETVALFNDF
eukprot:TRINITY_DN44449_c0_g1_i13.p1 TRINITY_DN44449_c0_g1~~TRINITY_DN44449_c0_g1_i13.p1  ORF type:complete len:435 (-),score=64.36 TRINITY_DN44449_c0_g1_i13:193-1497(-)